MPLYRIKIKSIDTKSEEWIEMSANNIAAALSSADENWSQKGYIVNHASIHGYKPSILKGTSEKSSNRIDL